jgi:hypothetical protein
VCGTCITRVLEGECDHRDLYFTDEERRSTTSSRRAARVRRARHVLVLRLLIALLPRRPEK